MDVICSTSENEPPYDPIWMETRIKKTSLKLEKLDNDLKDYKSNSIKESIRRHYLSCGDLPNALKCYLRAHDYCTSGLKSLIMWLRLSQLRTLVKEIANS
ncbi:hypothetical protein HA402_005341 [Bradysia odoriphaga]|nr:hypothetical protein HA402_005341 [Bradysia odoriphaga]